MHNKNHKDQPSEQQLLRELQELTSRQYVYEDLWCGMVPFDGKLTEMQTGPPERFANLHWRDQADILREFIHWDRYPERAWDDEYRIRENIEAGKPPEQWLEGTSLRQSFQYLAEGKTPPPVKRDPELPNNEDLAKLIFGQPNPAPAPENSRAADGPGPKAKDGNLSLQELRNESQEQVRRGEGERSKPREIER